MANSRISEETRARIAAAWPDILNKVAAGELVGETITAAGFSREMIRAYLASVPGARQEWDDARMESADAFFDQAQAIASKPSKDPKAARVQLQALQWLAGKRNPRVYGDRAQLDVNVKHVDLTRVIEAAQARLAAARAPALRDVSDAEVLPDLALPAALHKLMHGESTEQSTS